MRTSEQGRGAAAGLSFAELCAEHVGISSSQADRLVDIVTNMTREEAIDVGATKAASLVALARATPEDDTVSDLLRHGALPRAVCYRARAVASLTLLPGVADLWRHDGEEDQRRRSAGVGGGDR